MSASAMTKRALRLITKIDAVISSAETMLHLVATKARERLLTYLTEDQIVDIEKGLRMYIALLKEVRKRVVKGDRDYRKVRSGKNKLGNVVRGQTRITSSAARQVRTDLRRALGDGVLVDLLIQDAPLEARKELQEQLEHFLDILEDFNPEEYTLRPGMDPVNMDTKRTFLRGHVEELNTKVDSYNTAIRETEIERTILEELVRNEKRTVSNTIAILEAHYRFVGFDEEAKRLRYLIRRESSSSSSQGESDTPPADTAPDTPPADTSPDPDDPTPPGPLSPPPDQFVA